MNEVKSRSRVAVAACTSYSAEEVKAALAETLDALGGLARFVKPGQTVLLKPNLFSPHLPQDAVTTHPEVVRQVILKCFEAGARRVWVGDSPVAPQDDKVLWSRTGMSAAVEGTAAELKSWRGKQTAIPCGDDVLAIPEWFHEVDCLISLPKLKTHSLTTLTCALKNVYGIVSGPAKSQFHVKYPSPLSMSEFLVRMFSALKPHLNIADAITAMEGNGPAHGHPLPVGALLASDDAVALDSVSCQALAIEPATVPMIRLAATANLGQMEQIDIVGTGVATLQSVHMKPSFARYLARLPEGLFSIAQRLFRLRPKIENKLCVKCGICASVCPRQTIKQNNRTEFPLIQQQNCIDCFCCVESCPQTAIAVQLYFANLVCLGQQQRKPAVRE